MHNQKTLSPPLWASRRFVSVPHSVVVHYHSALHHTQRNSLRCSLAVVTVSWHTSTYTQRTVPAAASMRSSSPAVRHALPLSLPFNAFFHTSPTHHHQYIHHNTTRPPSTLSSCSQIQSSLLAPSSLLATLVRRAISAASYFGSRLRVAPWPCLKLQEAHGSHGPWAYYHVPLFLSSPSPFRTGVALYNNAGTHDKSVHLMQFSLKLT